MFSVGDLAIVLPVPAFDAEAALMRYIGEQVEILEGPMSGTGTRDFISREGYRVQHKDGKKFYVASKYLRKLDGYDGNTKITWDDMPYWKPKELVRV